MIRYQNLNIASKIAIPFSGFLIVIFLSIILYYPGKQREIFVERKISEMTELAKTVALGVELSIGNDDFQGLRRTLDFTASRADFKFIAILVQDFQELDVYLNYPEDIDDLTILSPDPNDFLIHDESFTAGDFTGVIRLGVSTSEIRKQIRSINTPIYLILLVSLLLSIIFSVLLARYISKPFEFLTFVVRELEKGNYNVTILGLAGKNELTILYQAFISLRDKLNLEYIKNKTLTNELEEKVEARTAKLYNLANRLNQAQKVSGLGSFAFDLKTNKIEVSDNLSEILGTNFTSQNFFSWSRIIRPEVIRKTIKHFQSNFRRNSRIAFDTDVVVEGETKWVNIAMELYFDRNNKPREIQGIIQDITQRKASEEEIRRLSLVAEKTSNSVIITDVHKRIIWANEALLRISGYQLDEIVGHTPRIFQFEKTNRDTIDYINSEINEKRPVTAEVLNRGKNGNEYWLEVNIVPLHDREDVLYGFIAVETDITERKETERKLEEAVSRLQAILDASRQVSIIVTDMQGVITMFNSGAERQLNYTSDEVVGRYNLDLFLHHEDMERKNLELSTEFELELDGFQAFAYEASIGKPTAKEWIYKRKDGSLIPVLTSVNPIVNNGEIFGYLSVGADISQLKNVEREIKSLLDITSRQNERLLNFAHIVSHNLRSHSSGLIGITKLIQYEYPEVSEGELMALLENGINKLEQTVKDLAEIVKVNFTEESITQSFMYDVVEKNIELLGMDIKKNGIQVINNLNTDLIVKGVTSYLDSIVLNMMTNAIKYRDPVKESYLKIYHDTDDSLVNLYFEDNGLGIDLKKHGDKLFGMYKTFHTHDDSRGVGLFITKNQVESMNGMISVISTVNVGTTFKLSFPL